MDPLYSQAVKSGVFGALFFVALIFVPAGTICYWHGWAFLAVFAASTTAFTVYLALYDKPLLERRIKAGPWHEKEWSQKIIVSTKSYVECGHDDQGEKSQEYQCYNELP